jgi:hypothetical protein
LPFETKVPSGRMVSEVFRRGVIIGNAHHPHMALLGNLLADVNSTTIQMIIKFCRFGWKIASN